MHFDHVDWVKKKSTDVYLFQRIWTINEQESSIKIGDRYHFVARQRTTIQTKKRNEQKENAYRNVRQPVTYYLMEWIWMKKL
jgi:hypothetical protein